MLCLLLTTSALVAADEARWKALDAEVIRLARSGDTGAARETAERALTLARESFGEDARTASSLTLLAEVRMMEGAWTDAEPLLLEAKAIRELTLEPLHPLHEESLNLLGKVYLETERLDEAERSFEASVMQARKAADLGLEGPQAPRWADIVAALDLMARLHLQRGDFEAMQSTHSEILDTVTRYAPSHDASLEAALLRRHRFLFERRSDDANAQRALRMESARAARESGDPARAEAVSEME